MNLIDGKSFDVYKRLKGARVTRRLHISVFAILLGLNCVFVGTAQGELNPGGEPRYGRHTLAPGFNPAPFATDVVSGGDIAVKPLALADNCLGFAVRDPDFVVELKAGFERITFLVAGAEDTTLIVNLPNGSWSCNDDTNGLNPGLVYYHAVPGNYQIWIGSYAAEAFDEGILYISEAGPETLPTTATGPDPARDPLYGEITLTRGFQPSPFAAQITGGGRSQAADHIADPECQAFVSEAPDYRVSLAGEMTDLWFGVYSPADMALLISAADESWHCSADYFGTDPAIGFSSALPGSYDIWIGSAEENNYAASIFYITEYEPEASPSFTIDTSCPGMLTTDLHVGERAVVSSSLAKMYAVPETASTVIFEAPPGTSMSLVGGPICYDEHRWWRAELSDGSRGWVADGDSLARWLEPTSSLHR